MGMHSSTDLDCIVVGYNDIDYEDLLERTSKFQKVSAGYKHLLANSLSYHGKRRKYIDVLNKSIEMGRGKSPELHVAKMPNLGAIYLSSFLKNNGYQSEFINFFNSEQEKFKDLLAQGPNLVAITTTFYTEHQPIREIIDFVRAHNPETKIVVGGPHIYNLCSAHPPKTQEILFQQMSADFYVFDSQGELSLSRLCKELRETSPNFAQVPNLIYKDGKTHQRGPREIENNDMDEAAVNWRLFDKDVLVPSVQTRTARSCAFKCSFCRYPVIAGDLVFNSMERIEQDFEYLASIGVTQLLFIDDTFNIPLKRFKELCRMMIRRKFGFRWFSYFRCANADDETFDLMAEAGCAGVFLGIESGDDTVLRAMNKAATVKRYHYGIKMLKERNIITFSSFIVGHPGETLDTVNNTLAFIEEAQPTYYCLEAFFFDPKVPIADKAQKYGLTGRAYSWKHEGMDVWEATDHVTRGYRSITGSTILPLFGFDLWSIGYLMGQGFEQEELTRFLKVSSNMLLDGLDNRTPTYPEKQKELDQVFAP